MKSLFRKAAPLAAAATLLAAASTAWYAQAGSPPRAEAAPRAGTDSIDRGRYIARIAACNDCHTPGYAESGGKVDEKAWLTGDRMGWQGAWGTTYASNLRLALAQYGEDDWVRLAKTAQYRPPMPWFILRDMNEADLRALYRYVRHLGPAGEPAPAYLPPGVQPRGPVVAFPMPPKQ